MTGRGKKEEMNKDAAEDWCFVCKEGGVVRICDYKDCQKSYHPSCVNKDESFLESEKDWYCPWHNCFRCHRSKCAYLRCYTCPNAVCRKCLPARRILLIEGKYGFCKDCLKLALLIEEKKDCDSDGEKVDFTDRETCEGLHMEYYDIIKKKEGFKLADIYAAKNRVKAKKYYQPNDDDEESDDEDDDYEEERLSDYDGLEEEESKKKGTHNISKRHRFTKQRPFNKSNKKEFIGWASRPLIEFLNSIGKNSTEKLSPFDVTSIVNKYVKENNLLNPGKRKSITCDERLLCLFGKKKIAKYKVFDLVEDHFAENQESDEDEIGYNSEDNNRETENACKRQRKIGIKKIPQEKIKEIDMPLSRFACIGVENIKLVYLRRGVLKEMLKEPESFEEKVSGCFVRVKSEPYDYRSRKSHQLIQVKGVKALPTEENTTEAILLLSAMPEEIRVSLLADEDFTEEECEELKNKILAGEVERPTVDFLQQRVNAIHKDVTNYWIHKELRLLKNRADLANEKGWRAEYFELLDRRRKLQSPFEQSRLLENVPTVMRDVYEPDDGEVNRDKLDSPDTGLDEYAQHNKHAKAKGRYSNVAVIDVESDDNLPTDQKTEADTENETWLMKGPNGERTDSSLSLLRLWSGSNVYASKFMVWRKGEKEENAIPLMEALTLAGRSK